MHGIVLNSTLGVNPGDVFRVIWFDRGIVAGEQVVEGDRYGLVASPIFVLPLDGVVQNYGADFVGPDPIRTPGLTFIPEPATALLGLLGIAASWRRRR